MTEMIGHVAETAGHDEPKTESVTMGRNPRSRYRNQRSRWSEIPKPCASCSNTGHRMPTDTSQSLPPHSRKPQRTWRSTRSVNLALLHAQFSTASHGHRKNPADSSDPPNRSNGSRIHLASRGLSSIAPPNHTIDPTQFSSSSAGTLLNSDMLLVTSTNPSLRACPAMWRSFTPIGCPSFSRPARMAP